MRPLLKQLCTSVLTVLLWSAAIASLINLALPSPPTEPIASASLASPTPRQRYPFTRCIGADPCLACSTCRACRHCHQEGGTCEITRAAASSPTPAPVRSR